MVMASFLLFQIHFFISLIGQVIKMKKNGNRTKETKIKSHANGKENDHQM